MRLTIVKLSLLCVSLIFGVLVLISISEAQLDLKGIVAMWLLDESTGDKVTDSSGNGNDGAFAKGKPKWVDGKFGKALSLDGKADWVEMDAPVVVDTVDFTMGCWANPGDNQKTWTNILSSHQEPPRRGISFEQIENNVIFNRALSEDEVKSITDHGLEGAQPVTPRDKVATSWGKLKTQY